MFGVELQLKQGLQRNIKNEKLLFFYLKAAKSLKVGKSSFFKQFFLNIWGCNSAAF